MSEKLYDELYPKRISLIGIKENYNVFYNSWWNDKCLSYSGDTLANYYDIFISRYVVYNSLYNIILTTKEKFGLIKPKGKNSEWKDFEKATTEILNQLSPSIIDFFFSDYTVSNYLTEIINLIVSKQFAICHTLGKPNYEKDIVLVNELRSNIKKEKVLGILKLIYSVRCNLFHGSKGYETNQIALLKPLNHIIYELVSRTYDLFECMLNNLIQETETEIAAIEE